MGFSVMIKKKKKEGLKSMIHKLFHLIKFSYSESKIFHTCIIYSIHFQNELLNTNVMSSELCNTHTFTLIPFEDHKVKYATLSN